MTAAIERTGQGAALAVAQSTVDAARGFAAAARASATVRAYRASWGAFVAWCEAAGLEALPAHPSGVALYLAERAKQGRKVSTLRRELAAISQAHKAAGCPSPRGAAEVQEVMKGIRRTIGVAPNKKAPFMGADLVRAVAALPGTLLGARDRALLLVGFAGAFRRSELVALTVADLAFTAEGLAVTLRRSKTDQEGAGRTVAIPYAGNPAACPVRALRAWLEAASVTAGPVFRSVSRHGAVSAEGLSPLAVALVVKRAVAAAGMDPAKFSGHSLRAGLATTAAKRGKTMRAIMGQGRWASETTARGYIRDAEMWADNAAAGLLD